MLRFFLIIITLTFINSCGKKGALEYQGKRDQPLFDNVCDEMEEKFNPKKSELSQ